MCKLVGYGLVRLTLFFLQFELLTNVQLQRRIKINYAQVKLRTYGEITLETLRRLIFFDIRSRAHFLHRRNYSADTEFTKRVKRIRSKNKLLERVSTLCLSFSVIQLLASICLNLLTLCKLKKVSLVLKISI